MIIPLSFHWLSNENSWFRIHLIWLHPVGFHTFWSKTLKNKSFSAIASSVLLIMSVKTAKIPDIFDRHLVINENYISIKLRKNLQFENRKLSCPKSIIFVMFLMKKVAKNNTLEVWITKAELFLFFLQDIVVGILKKVS